MSQRETFPTKKITCIRINRVRCRCTNFTTLIKIQCDCCNIYRWFLKFIKSKITKYCASQFMFKFTLSKKLKKLIKVHCILDLSFIFFICKLLHYLEIDFSLKKNVKNSSCKILKINSFLKIKFRKASKSLFFFLE